jgi:hypothetical protein
MLASTLKNFATMQIFMDVWNHTTIKIGFLIHPAIGYLIQAGRWNCSDRG